MPPDHEPTTCPTTIRLEALEQRVGDRLDVIQQRVEEMHRCLVGNGTRSGLKIQFGRLEERVRDTQERLDRQSKWLGGLGIGVIVAFVNGALRWFVK